MSGRVDSQVGIGCTCVVRLQTGVHGIYYVVLFFFFQAEDGIRDKLVTGVQTCALPIFFARMLQDAGVAIGKRETGNGKRVVLVYAEPRSWKGRADLGARSRAALRRLVPGAALVVLFGHPRLASQIPGTAPILLSWDGQPLMQRAAARWVMANMR